MYIIPFPGLSKSPARYMASNTISDCSSETITLIISFCSSIVTPSNPNFSFTDIINWYDNYKEKESINGK